MANPWDPTWQPNWTDVHFDAGLAQAAISTLNQVADQLQATTAERRSLADTARRDWQGRYRHDFDERFEAGAQTADHLVADLRAAAQGVGAAMAHAAQAEQQRLADRQRWLQQQADNKAKYDLAQQQAAQQAAQAQP